MPEFPVTIYACPVEGCPSFIGMDTDSEDGRGDLGWNPDGWPRCTDHNRPMKPIKVAPPRKTPPGMNLIRGA